MLIHTPDYAYLAVTAAFGRPSGTAVVDDHDPRKPRPPDPLEDPGALAVLLGRHPRAWLVTARTEHSDARIPNGVIRARNSDYTLVELAH